MREISIPNASLKYLQKEIANVFYECVSEIKKQNLSYLSNNHAFERNKSISSNARIHRGKRYLLNLDLKDFFQSIHYGRIISFLQNDRYFSLSPNLSKIIAKLATYHGYLPQGSPLSPILASLIGNLLDVRLIAIAKKYRLNYTRYADDITFSSNRDFSSYLLVNSEGNISLNNEILDIISRCGFEVNHKKTRYTTFKTKQVVTGVIVNKILNTDKEYRKKNRAMVYSLLSTGNFYQDYQGILNKGNLNRLIGRINHAISIKYRETLINELRINCSNISNDELKKQVNLNLKDIFTEGSYKGIDNTIKDDGQIKLLRDVLFYKYFVDVSKITIIVKDKIEQQYWKVMQKDNINIVPINNEMAKLGLSKDNIDINRFFNYLYQDNCYIDFFKIKVKPKFPVIFIIDYNQDLDAFSNKIFNKFIDNYQYACIKENIYLLLLNSLSKDNYGNYTFYNNKYHSYIENFIKFKGTKLLVDQENRNKIFYSENRFLSRNTLGKYIKSGQFNNFSFDEFSKIYNNITRIVDDFRSKYY
ncbi:hypothetical protein A6A20_10200 [Volucribacter amazonae]|uniref:RNA-directed DNA polymerase n=2 Tax=Volucribacter amazonae TaxID=256731 RepID=A0A9X4SLB2_9PAST|nr:hypothetical protein [Volucribacter amazonae]